MPNPSTPPKLNPTGAKLAVAACSMTLTGARELQLMPAGVFHARDGRPTDAPGWKIDAALAQILINAANARDTPYAIDYDHQTLRAKDNGKPAPAAGWFKSLEWREGVGLFAVDVEWTEGAAGMIESNEYKFISPVIGYDKATGAVTALHMAAITNTPAIDGMDEVLLTAALSFNFPSHPTPLSQEIPMDELLEQLRWMLNLPLASTADDIKAQLQKLIGLIKEDPAATAAASFDLAAWITTQRTAVASLSTAIPDPAKYVPVDVMQGLQTQVAQLTAKLSAKGLDDVIAAALSAGRLLPAQEDWARMFGAKDLAALSAYIDSAPPLAALAGMQSGGKAPAGITTPGALTVDQVALCTAFGIAQDDFRKTLAAEVSGA